MESYMGAPAIEKYSGIILYVSAVFSLSIMDAAGKWLTETIPTGEILFFRALFGFCPIILIYLFQRKTAEYIRIVPKSWAAQLWRGVSVAIVGFSFFMAVQGMRLADATAIAMTGPILMVVFGVVFLREQLSFSRCIFASLSFIGVLLIVQPSTEQFSWYAVAAFISAASYATSAIQTRRLMRTDSYLQVSLWTTVVILTFSLFCIPWETWVIPSKGDWMPLMLMGLMGGVSNMLFSAALKKSEVSFLATLDYSIFIWAIVFGFLLFGEVPTLLVFAGAGLIVVCGVCLARASPPQVIADADYQQSAMVTARNSLSDSEIDAEEVLHGVKEESLSLRT